MAFDSKKFGRTSGGASVTTITNWSYLDTVTDTLATIMASAFFNDFADVLKINDMMNLVGTDDYSTVIVTAVSPNVTVTEYAVAVVEDGSITTAKLANLAVTAAKLNTDAVTTDKILDANVTTAKILDANVTTAKILNANVTTDKILDLNVTTGKLEDDAVTTVKILDANVTTAKILDANVTTAKILDANVTTAKILDLNVTTGKLAADAVDDTKLADNAVSLEHLDSGITPSHVVVYGGSYTTTGGAAVEDITVAGVTAADFAFVEITDDGTNNVTKLYSVAGTDKITVTYSGNPGGDLDGVYQVIRAVS